MKIMAIILKTQLAAAFFLLTACQTAHLSSVAIQPTPTPAKIESTVTPSSPVTDDDNINRPTSEPYVGDLSIFESQERAKNLQIERVMDILKIGAGKSVADIGAGGGWFTVRAAKRTGSDGKVFAVEINQDYLNHIAARAEKENLPNIQTVLGTEDNPKLPENAVDAVLILKTYHEIGQPVKVLKNLLTALKKGALVGVIDRNGNGADHGIQMQVVIDEFKRAGFEKIADYDFVKPDGMDYFLVFRVKNNP